MKFVLYLVVSFPRACATESVLVLLEISSFNFLFGTLTDGVLQRLKGDLFCLRLLEETERHQTDRQKKLQIAKTDRQTDSQVDSQVPAVHQDSTVCPCLSAER